MSRRAEATVVGDQQQRRWKAALWPRA